MIDEVEMDYLVSVIVPVYNAEPYIVTCVESIVNQTYEKVEIILINDGSTDSSGKVLDDLQARDARIKVVHKENGGVSSARNRGLDRASGDFVMFTDSDDWIDEEMVEKMVRAATHYHLDMVTCGMRYINMKGVSYEIPRGYRPLGEKLETKQACFEIIKELVYGGGSLCCRLISRSLVLDERLIEGMRISEDQEWLIRIATKAVSMVYIPEIYYNVRVRSGSMTTMSCRSDIEDIEIVNQRIIEWAGENDMVNHEVILNALAVRSRLQYSSAVRALCNSNELSRLKKKMVLSYRQSKNLHPSERLKYCIALLPPKLYLLTRTFLKAVRSESV